MTGAVVLSGSGKFPSGAFRPHVPDSGDQDGRLFRTIRYSNPNASIRSLGARRFPSRKSLTCVLITPCASHQFRTPVVPLFTANGFARRSSRART